MDALRNIGLHLSDLILSLVSFILLLRALFFFFSADPSHPLIKAIISITSPMLALPSKIFPVVYHRVDLACWASVFLINAVALYLKTLLIATVDFHAVFFIIAFFQMVESTLQIFLISTLGLSVASWFMSPYQLMAHPVISLLHLLIAPLLNPLRRVLPNFGPVDISPMVLLFIIYVAMIVVRSLY